MTGEEQHLPYRATGDVVVLDGDGSRWVRKPSAMALAERRVIADRLRKTVERSPDGRIFDYQVFRALQLGYGAGGYIDTADAADVLRLADLLDGGYGGRAA